MLFGLALPNRGGHVLSRKDGTFGRGGVVERIVSSGLLRRGLIGIVGAIRSVPPLASAVVAVAVVAGSGGRGLGGLPRRRMVVGARRTWRNNDLGARHVV